MTDRDPSRKKPYRTYDRYPISADDRRQGYDGSRSNQNPDPREPRGDDQPETRFDLAGDAGAVDFASREPRDTDRKDHFKPLSLLRTLFADRLDLLRTSLDELERAESERSRLTNSALDDIDSRIAECESALAVLRGERILNDIERRKHLERHLLELKRQRHQEAVLSWRDLLSLRREIASLQREVASVTGTVSSAGKHRAGRDDDG